MNEELTFTVLDPDLVKNVTKTKCATKTKKKKRMSSQPVAKKCTHKKITNGSKCTPMDRNINATQKLLFKQLQQIKLEVKLETLSENVSSTLKQRKVVTVPDTAKNTEHDQPKLDKK